MGGCFSDVRGGGQAVGQNTAMALNSAPEKYLRPDVLSTTADHLRLDVYDNHSTACVYKESSLSGEVRQFSSLNKMREENLVTSLERVEGSGLASQGLSVGAHESIINPMTNSDDALESAAMDENRAGKRKEELFGPKDNLAVGLSDGGGLALQGVARMHQRTNPCTNPGLYHSYAAIQRRDEGSGRANSQGLSVGAPLQGQALQGAVIHMTHPMTCFDSLATLGRDIFSSLASLGVSPDDLESQGADIPVLERIYHLLSEHDQTFQHWLRDAGTVGASFAAVYANPSLATQLPAAVAFITTLTSMWLPRKHKRAKIILTKFGAIASIASVMSAMSKHLSPVGMGIVGALLLIPSGVILFG